MAYTYDIKTSQKDNRSTICLSVCHLIYTVVNLFLSTFLVAHIYSLTDNIYSYAMNVGIYELTTYGIMFITYPIFSILVDKTNRIWFYRIANILTAGLVVITIFYGQDLAKIIYLAGILKGFSHSAYYASYNVLKQEMVSRKFMEKFAVILMVLTKLVNVVFPVLLGVLIDISTFSMVAIYVLALASVLIILTFFIKAKRPENSNFDLKGYFKRLKENPSLYKKVKLIYIICIFYGFNNIVTSLLNINIMTVFGSNLSLGTITSVCALVATIVLILISRFTKISKRSWIFIISAILPVLGASIFIAVPSMVSLIAYHVFISINEVITAAIFDIHRNKNLKEAGLYQDIAEHQCIVESIFQITRCVSYSLLILMGAIQNHIIFQVFFGVFVILYAITSILLLRYEQKLTLNNETKEEIVPVIKSDTEKNSD